MNALEIFFQYLLNGLSAGALYALIAVGLTMTYGILHVTNFSHGEFMTIGAVVTYALCHALGVDYLPSVVAGALAAAVVGIITERLVFRPTLKKPINGLVVSLGLITAFQNSIAWIAGTRPLYIDPPFPGVSIIFGARIADQRLAALAAGLAVIALTGALLRFTSIGRSLRAIAVDVKAALLMGVKPNLLYAIAFGVGCLLAGFAGGLLSVLVPIHPFMGGAWVAKAFVVIVLGGLGSFSGAVAGGLILGVVESLGAGYISSNFTDAFGFLTLILLLLYRPTGLFGAVERRA